MVLALMAWTLHLWGSAGGHKTTAETIVMARRQHILRTFGLREVYDEELRNLVQDVCPLVTDDSAASALKKVDGNRVRAERQTRNVLLDALPIPSSRTKPLPPLEPDAPVGARVEVS